MRGAYAIPGLAFLPVIGVLAGEADVLDAEIRCDNHSVCSFSVTVQHSDTGWDHYADKWEILDEDRQVISVRELEHPHVDEQPFTRSLGRVEIPAGLDRVIIRAHDSVHGYGGEELVVDLP
jgi:hypothetical protein